MSAILALLGSSALRAIGGQLMSWLTKRQDHKQELQRLEMQGKLDAAAYARSMEGLRLQADLGVKTVTVQADADITRSDAAAFRDAVAKANTLTGVSWVDGWNGCIRPAFATVSLGLWALCLHRAGWQLTDWDLSMIGAIVGYWYADRSLRKMGK